MFYSVSLFPRREKHDDKRQSGRTNERRVRDGGAIWGLRRGYRRWDDGFEEVYDPRRPGLTGLTG